MLPSLAGRGHRKSWGARAERTMLLSDKTREGSAGGQMCSRVVSEKWMVKVRAESRESPSGWAGSSTVCPCASLAYCSSQHPRNRAQLVPCAQTFALKSGERTTQLRCFELAGLRWGRLKTSYSFVGKETCRSHQAAST